MSTDLLFEHFATLATAPGGIVRLRELILQLAVQGKLGTQDEGDEPASVLLARIQKERTHLIKNGTIKRTDQFLPVDPEECQYEIPDGWHWTRLGTLVADSKQDIVDGPFGSDLHSAEYVDSGIPVIRLQNVQRNQFLNKNIRFLTPDKAEYLSRHNFVCGDIVVTKLGEPVGKACIVPEYLKSGIFVADIIRIRLDSRFVDTNYITFMINSPFISLKFNGLVKGITRARVNLTKVREMVIPLPPLAEQYRIVAKVNRLMAICDEIEAQQQKERGGCLRLGTASLAGLQNAESQEEFERLWAQVCDAFDLILDCPENVAVLRQTILYLAIYGKFKTQDAVDKPVKIDTSENDDSKNRSLGIFKLINLPKKWVWTNLGDISKVGQGGTPSTNFPEYWNGSVPWLRSGDIKFNRIKKANETISELGLKNSAATLCPIGTVMLAMTGQGVTRGRAAILDIETSANQSCAHIILDKDKMIPEFLFYFFRTEYWNIRTLDKGTGQPGLNTKIIKMFDIPLPPLAEQERIVAKVDALMALCDALESRLKERVGMQGRLAGAVVKGVTN